jgi:hypothetical protein
VCSNLATLTVIVDQTGLNGRKGEREREKQIALAAAAAAATYN